MTELSLLVNKACSEPGVVNYLRWGTKTKLFGEALVSSFLIYLLELICMFVISFVKVSSPLTLILDYSVVFFSLDTTWISMRFNWLLLLVLATRWEVAAEYNSSSFDIFNLSVIVSLVIGTCFYRLAFYVYCLVTILVYRSRSLFRTFWSTFLVLF